PSVASRPPPRSALRLLPPAPARPSSDPRLRPHGCVERNTMRSRRSLAASAAAAALALCALGSAPAAVAFTAAPPPSSSRRAAAGGAAAGRRRVGRGGVVRLSSTKSGGGSGNKAAIDADESSEYEYDESEFADYSSDYSDLPDALSSSSDEDEDDDEIEGSLLDAYDDYDAIGGYDLSPFERHAREVFLTYAERVESKLDHEADDLAARENEECESTQLANAAILKKDLYEMLGSLDIEASRDEAESLFKFLDVNGDGSVSLEEFMPWYAEAVDAAQGVSAAFQDLVKSRSTVHRFDATEVDDGVLRRALECAVAAPNRQGETLKFFECNASRFWGLFVHQGREGPICVEFISPYGRLWSETKGGVPALEGSQMYMESQYPKVPESVEAPSLLS
ncbi:hypothetical protein ACHAWF_004977, partial [Thalassiosira exigua]